MGAVKKMSHDNLISLFLRGRVPYFDTDILIDSGIHISAISENFLTSFDSSSLSVLSVSNISVRMAVGVTGRYNYQVIEGTTFEE